MKFLVFLSLFISLSSCFLFKKHKQDTVIITDTPVTKIFKDTSFYRLLVSRNSLDTSKLEIAYQYYLQPKKAWQDSVNCQISNFIYSSTKFELDTIFSASCSDINFPANLDSFVVAAQEDYLSNDFGALWALEIKTSISDEFASFATIGSGMYIYSGGAHGNTFYNHLNIEKASGKNLQLSDFISDTLEFNRIAEACFRQQNDISEHENLTDLGFWFNNDVFDCNDNFYVSEFGFHFTFNAYEVAPYSHGVLEFNVPFSLCDNLLKIDLSKK